MERMIKVNYRDLETKEFMTGTTLREISKSFQRNYNFPILIAKVDNELAELSEPITKKCDIDFYDRSSSIGNSIYGRSLQFLVVVAARRLFGSDTDVVVEHSIDKGFYCEIHGASIDKPSIRALEKEMKKLVEEDLNFTKISVSRIEAINFFRKKKQIDKAKVLKYISNTYINLYRLDDYYDYYYGDLAYSTSQIDEFKLTYIKDNGFVVGGYFTGEINLNGTIIKKDMGGFIIKYDYNKNVLRKIVMILMLIIIIYTIYKMRL